MRIKKILLTLLIVSVLFCIVSISVFAMNTGFSTDDMELDAQQTFLNNINLSLVTEEPKKNAISCFDVNENGMVAIGSGYSERTYISVYTSDGIFKYGYSFNCDGSIGVEWDGNNIIIYFVRSDVAALFDASGTNLELKKIQNTIDNNSYWNQFVDSTERTVNENRYFMRNDMGIFNFFATSYSQIIRTDADGNETAIYDISDNYKTKFAIISIIKILFVTIILSVIILQLRKKHR